MKKLIKILILFTLLHVVSSPKVFAISVEELQSGDVVLLSLNCLECRMIESETNSLFSHSGVVIRDESGRVRIAQSLGVLDHFSFAEFTKNITPGTFVHVYRARELSHVSSYERYLLEEMMLKTFNEKFRFAPFDSKFKWDNFNASGVEYLYCSEFIAKFLDHFLSKKTVPTPITYNKNIEYWFKYFKGNVPENDLGNSPASFTRDHRFEFIGTI